MSQGIFSQVETNLDAGILPLFRKESQENYFLFRNFYQIIDMISLNINSYRYKDRSIVLATMYLSIGLSISVFNLEKIIKYFPLHTQILTQYSDYNSVFREFMNIQIGLDFCDILEAIQYASRFYLLKMDYSSPFLGPENEKVFMKII